MKKDTSKSKGKKETKEGFAFYIGIDLGDKNSDVCVLDQRGEVGKEFRLRMKEEDFQTYFASIPRSRVAVEAGGQSRWVAEVIEKCGHEVYVSNTRKVPYIHQSDDKDDPGDAYKLAELLYFKPRLLHPIQHRSREAQADLSWIRAREVLVASRTQLINAVRGIRYYDEMEEHIARERYPKYWLWEQVNGVGVHTALSFMLTIGDPERFEKSRMVGSFLGLRPKKQESGESKPQLGIAKAGNVYLRKTLVNCAHYILGPKGKDSDLRRCGLRICARGGKNAKKRAVIAVARKLAVVLHRLWITSEVYEPLRNSKQLIAA